MRLSQGVAITEPWSQECIRKCISVCFEVFNSGGCWEEQLVRKHDVVTFGGRISPLAY